MKRILTPALACLLLASLCGCAQDREEGGKSGAYRLYYSALGDQMAATAVGVEYTQLPQDAQPVPTLIESLLDGPTETGLSSPFPDGTRLLDWALEDEGCLRLDLSEQYGSLTGVDLTVADACLTLTLCQVEGVEAVYVTVEGSEIPYRPIQQLTADSILLEQMGTGFNPLP